MIRHIIFFGARTPSDIATIRAGLDLLTAIDAASHIEIALNTKTDTLSREVDLVVYAEFADTAALDRFRADPLYQQAIDIVRPLRDLRIAADIVVDPQGQK